MTREWRSIHLVVMPPRVVRSCKLLGSGSALALLALGACAKPHLCDEANLAECEEQCAREHAGSCERLGKLLAAKGPSSNPARALELYRKACSQDAYGACWRAGDMASSGIGMARDDELAGRLYRRACEVGKEPAGCHGLGMAYWMGVGQKQDDKVAAANFQTACDNGFGASCGMLALLAKQKRIPEVDPKTMAEWRRLGCEAGNVESCCELGWAAAEEKQEEKAIGLFLKACKGHPLAPCCDQLEALDVSPETGKRTERSTADPGPTPATPQEVADLVRGGNDFALRLGTHLRAKPGNFVYSPASISLGAALVFGGARGETEKQMAASMGFTLGQDRLHVTYATILAQWAKTLRGGSTVLYAANRLFGQTGYRFEPGFVQLTGNRYGAALQPLDFHGAPSESARVINQWVEAQTRKQIKNIVTPDNLPANTRIALVNAMYFKGKWVSPFPEGQTKDAPFHVSGAKVLSVPTMKEMSRRPYAKVGAATVVELPYEGSACALTLLIPDAVDGLPALESSLTEPVLAKWLAKAEPKYVTLSLPRFVIHEDIDLKQLLPKLGLTTLFGFDADLSGMGSEKPLFLGAALHKAFIAVDEKGTEAAAVTAGFGAGFGRGPDSIEVKADRPFLFLLRDTATGLVLFAGRVSDPTES